MLRLIPGISPHCSLFHLLVQRGSSQTLPSPKALAKRSLTRENVGFGTTTISFFPSFVLFFFLQLHL